jgi:hypothetical protein
MFRGRPMPWCRRVACDRRPRTMYCDRVAPCRGRAPCGDRLGAMLRRRATMCSGWAATVRPVCGLLQATGRDRSASQGRLPAAAAMFSDRVAFDQGRAGPGGRERGSLSSLCLIDVETPLRVRRRRGNILVIHVPAPAVRLPSTRFTMWRRQCPVKHPTGMETIS